MRELIKRIVRRSIFIAIVLGIMGYAFAEAYLLLSRMAGAIPNPANDDVRWQAPLRMAGIGVAILIFLEVIFYFVRRKHETVPASLDELPDSPPPPGPVL